MFELVNLVKQADNFTKTIQWGLLLVKPFENYDNFTVEEQIVILQIRLAISLAKFRLYNFSEALNEMESILDAVSGSPAIQNEEIIAHINDTICSYMLIWPGKYMYICHCKTSWAVIKLLIDVTMDLPPKCVYATFVIPFDLYPPNSKGTYYNGVRQSKTNALSEQKYSKFSLFFLRYRGQTQGDNSTVVVCRHFPGIYQQQRCSHNYEYHNCLYSSMVASISLVNDCRSCLLHRCDLCC